MTGSLLIIAKGFTDVAGVQYLIPSRNQAIFTKSVVTGAILNVVLNFILIPICGCNRGNYSICYSRGGNCNCSILLCEKAN